LCLFIGVLSETGREVTRKSGILWSWHFEEPAFAEHGVASIVIGSINIFTEISAPVSAHRIKPGGPASSRNSFGNKANSARSNNAEICSSQRDPNREGRQPLVRAPQRRRILVTVIGD